MMTINELKEKVHASESSEQAIQLLNAFLAENPKSDEALTMRGMQWWSMGERAKAINDYLAAIKINPESKAKLALKTANEILDYYNKDLYNP